MPASNIFQQFAQGQQMAQQRALRDQQIRQGELLGQIQGLQQQVAQEGINSEAFKSLAGLDPSSATKLKGLLQTDDQGLDAAFKDGAVFKNLLQNDPTGNSAIQFGMQRLQSGQSQGRNMIHTQRFLEEVQQDPATALKSISSFLSIPQELAEQKKTNFAPEISPVQTDPETGQKFIIRTDKNTGEVQRINAEGALGETTNKQEERIIRRELIKDATKESKLAFDGLKNIKSNLGTIDEAIAAIDKGASSGVVENFFPSFTEATVALENTANRMGLDVISATTFGALSEGELKLAMNTAMPRNLKPKALRKWLVDRKQAQKKLARELSSMAIKLGKGKTTIPEYLEQSATFKAIGETQQQPIQAAVQVPTVNQKPLSEMTLEELQALRERGGQ